MTEFNSLIDELNINSFILGFPKCATTSFAQWIEKSPIASVTGPKETNLFVPELVNKKNIYMPKRLDARSKVRIEASTLNVYSQDLLETLEKRDDIKVILITRSLSEVAESWHNQMLKASFIEEGTTLSDLLCSSSTSGLKNYREMLAHGNLIDKWITKLGHKRVFVMDCTELKNNSLRIAALLDKFFDCKLELPEVVPVSNVYSSPRNQLLYKFVRTSFFKRIWYSIESNFPYLRKIRIFLREKILLKKSVKQKEFEIKNHSWLINEENIARDMIVKNRNVWRES